MKTCSGALAVLVSACALLGGAPAAGHTATIANLRVEAGGTALSPGTSYVNDTARLRTSPHECGGSGRTVTVEGPTAIGIVEYANDTNRRLRPYFVSDQFSFGLIVCQIGGFGGFSANQHWLYKVNHVSPPVGAQGFKLRRGDEVLWYFANSQTGRNTGDELVLGAPARARPGEPFTVKVVAFDTEGRSRPAADVLVTGDAVGLTDANGETPLVATREGSFDTRGTRGSDIPTQPLSVCVSRNLRECPARRGEVIVGTSRGERIRGTRGGDLVSARSGNDRIDARGGDRDRVRCGRGRDSVLADRRDRAARDCERVRRR